MLVLEGQKYFEDIEIGTKGVGLGRTVDFADVINFGNIAGDFNPVHFDKEFSKVGMMGQQMAHGLCVTSLLDGMFIRTDLGAATTKTLLEFVELRELKYAMPVLFGDTIKLHFEVMSKEDVDERTGLIELKFEVYNQKDEMCQFNSRIYRFAKRGYDFEAIAARGEF